MSEDMTPEEFLNWVANWVLDGDPVTDEKFFSEPGDEGTLYEMDNDEAFANYETIVSEARRLIGKVEA